jgi:hypothetical protein
MSKIFGSNAEEVKGGCKILHNEQLHDLYSSLNAHLLLILSAETVVYSGKNRFCLPIYKFNYAY